MLFKIDRLGTQVITKITFFQVFRKLYTTIYELIVGLCLIKYLNNNKLEARSRSGFSLKNMIYRKNSEDL